MTAVAERRDVARARAADGREFLTTGHLAVRFIERHCCHTKGKWRGRPFRLLPWQKVVLYELFEVDPDTGKRRYRWAYIEVPKKNGKTELVAALNLYLLCGDHEPNPEIACAANSDEQADLVFGAAKTMCELSPTLAAITDRFAKEIVLKENPASKIGRKSAAVGTNDGPSFSGVTCDEFHEFDGEKGEGLFTVLTNATVAREEPLVIIITTAGADLDSLCGRYHQQAERIIAGADDDPTFYARIWQTADTRLLDGKRVKLDIFDDAALEAALREANPSYGHTVHLPFYKDQRRRISVARFKRYFLDIWGRDEEDRWLPPGAWEACAAEPFEFQADAPLFLGLDASLNRDSTSLCMVQSHGENFRVRWRRWRAPFNPITGRPVDGWAIPQADILAALRELGARYDVRSVPFDPYAMRLVAESAQAEGLPMLKFDQTDARMVPATGTAHELILAGRIEHDGDPDAAAQMADAIARSARWRTGQRIAKTPDRRANDDVVSLCMALHEATLAPEPQQAEPKVIWLDEEGDE